VVKKQSQKLKAGFLKSDLKTAQPGGEKSRKGGGQEEKVDRPRPFLDEERPGQNMGGTDRETDRKAPAPLEKTKIPYWRRKRRKKSGVGLKRRQGKSGRGHSNNGVSLLAQAGSKRGELN